MKMQSDYERGRRVRAIIAIAPGISLTELALAFGVREVTIRKDARTGRRPFPAALCTSVKPALRRSRARVLPVEQAA